MAEKKDSVKEITEKLEQGLKELFDSERYKTYLNTMSKFHNYSFNNTLLIAMQKPDATLVAGFNSWQKNFDRHVNFLHFKITAQAVCHMIFTGSSDPIRVHYTIPGGGCKVVTL